MAFSTAHIFFSFDFQFTHDYLLLLQYFITGQDTRSVSLPLLFYYFYSISLLIFFRNIYQKF